MTCKECIYYEACEHFNNGDAAELAEKAVETKCPIFKDKSRFVELPEGAITLTREEIKALNEYQKKYGAGVKQNACKQ